MEQTISHCFDLKTEKIERKAKEAKSTMELINELIKKNMRKQQTEKDGNSTYIKKKTIDGNEKTYKTAEKLFANLKQNLKELLHLLEDKDDSEVIKSDNKKYNLDVNKTKSNDVVLTTNENLTQGDINDSLYDEFSIEKLNSLKDEIKKISNNMEKNETNLINVFFSHLSNNPYIDYYNKNSSFECINEFENEENEKEIKSKIPIRKKTTKKFNYTNNLNSVTTSCDLLNLSGYQITSSSNMSKDTFPSMIAVFQTSNNKDYLTYINNLKYEIIVLEFNPDFKFKNDSIKKFFVGNKIKLRGHFSNINCLKYYFFKGKDILFSSSEDGTIKGWDCTDFHLEMNISYGETLSEPVYSINILTYQEENYLLVGSYSKNSPIKVYNNLQGIILKYLKVQGYTYNIDSYVDENNEIKLIFISVFVNGKYEVVTYDFDSEERLWKFNTLSYVHSFNINHINDTRLVLTMMDRTGTLYQYNLASQKPILITEKSGFGYYGLIKWDSKYFVSVGKEASMDIIDSTDLNIVVSYKLAHNSSIRNLCKFKHSHFGFVIFTYGEDQIIKLFK